MLRKMSFAILASLFVSVAANAQETKQTLTEKLQVTFPAPPVKRDMGPSANYQLKLADSTANFTATVIDLEKANGITVEALSMAMLDPGFWDQMEQGMMQQMGKDAKVTSRQPKKVGELEARELIIERPNPSGGTSQITVWVMIDGKNSINVVHNNRTGKADTALKDKFFASLTAAK
jgi:hypothetical protein